MKQGAKFTGRLMFAFAEAAIEIRERIEARRKCDLADVVIGLDQLNAGVTDPGVIHKKAFIRSAISL